MVVLGLEALEFGGTVRGVLQCRGCLRPETACFRLLLQEEFTQFTVPGPEMLGFPLQTLPPGSDMGFLLRPETQVRLQTMLRSPEFTVLGFESVQLFLSDLEFRSVLLGVLELGCLPDQFTFQACEVFLQFRDPLLRRRQCRHRRDRRCGGRRG